MPAWAWVLIAIGILIVIALIAGAVLRTLRTRGLRDQFGPEYDRTVRRRADRREAEAELQGRRERREELDIRPLTHEAAERYARDWRAVQARFVDEPAAAVADADRLTTTVMRDQGYPMDEFESQAQVISVDHPQVVQDYRRGHAIFVAHDRGDATTEDLRRAMVHYRSLFDELLVANRDVERIGGEAG